MSKKFTKRKLKLNIKKLKKYLKENRKTIILIISAILFITVTIAIFNNKITAIDRSVHNQILEIRTPRLTSTLLTITNISSAYSLIVISIILMFIMKNKKIPTLISMNLICSFLFNQIAKLIFTRPRPTGINLIEESGFSYPSGHAMVSMAYFGFIAYLIYKNMKNKVLKSILITALFILIIITGYSRIYLGVHYLSDIIGGFLLSAFYLTIFTNQIKKELV